MSSWALAVSGWLLFYIQNILRYLAVELTLFDDSNIRLMYAFEKGETFYQSAGYEYTNEEVKRNCGEKKEQKQILENVREQTIDPKKLFECVQKK